jgi:selenocysteine lyase/cysteine desulfurase
VKVPNWNEIRKQFPPVQRWTYLNTAAGGPMNSSAAEAAKRYYDESYTNGDTSWNDWLARMDQSREVAAAFINAKPDEVAFVANTSVALNLAIQMLERGEVVLVRDDFPSITLPWLLHGFPVRFIDGEPDGVVPLDRVADAIGPSTRYVAVGSVQFRTGFRHDLNKLGALCRDRGVLLIVDASQGAGVFPLDVQEQGIAVLAFSVYKWLMAGYGLSPLYVNQEILASRPLSAVGWRSAERPFDLVSDRLELSKRASALELGQPLFPAMFSLAGSLRLLNEIGLAAIEARDLELTAHLHAGLDARGIPILSPRSPEHRSAITMVQVSDPPAVVAKLKRKDVFVSARGKGVRVSPHFYNNREDIERFVSLLAGMV